MEALKSELEALRTHQKALKSELEALELDKKALNSELKAFSKQNQTSLAYREVLR